LRKIIKDHHFETSIRAKSNPSLSKRFQLCINLLLIGACKSLCKFTHICVGWFVNWIWCQFQLEEAYFAVNWEVVCKWISFLATWMNFSPWNDGLLMGFKLSILYKKTFPRRTNRRKKCQSHSNSRKEKSSCAYLKRTNCFLANSILRRRCDTILSQKLWNWELNWPPNV